MSDSPEPGSKTAGSRTRTAGRVVLAAVLFPAILGTITGLVVSGVAWIFEIQALGSITASLSPWVILFILAALPLSLITMRFVAGTLTPSTNELYIRHANKTPKQMPLRELPGRVLAGGATVACGGAQGMESPSASLGAGLGDVMERATGPLIPKRQQGFLMMSGASAGLAAIFSSPGVGAFYGLEVPFRRGFDLRPLIQSTIAAVAAFAARALTIGVDPLIPFAEEPVTVDVQLIGVALVLALVCGLGGRLFSNATNLARRWRKQLRPVIGTSIASVILVAMGLGAWLATGAWITMGPGHVMFDWAIASPQGVWMLALALVLHAGATVVCVFGGGGGGVFTSLTVTGALLGCIATVLLGCPEALYLPLVGGACLLSAAYRIPFAGMMLIIEWGGGFESALLGIVCIWLAQACVGRTTIAPAQAASPGDVKHV